MMALLLSTDWGKQNVGLACAAGFLGDVCIAIMLARAFGG